MPSGIYIRTKYHCNRISSGKKGITPKNINQLKGWCKGKHLIHTGSFKKGHITTDEVRRKISLSKKGVSNWKLKGRPKSLEHRKKMSLSRAGKKRKPHSEETKLKMSKSQQGKKRDDEFKRKCRIHRATQIFPKKDTSIEIKMQKLLKQLGITFFTHQYIKEIEHSYQCDIMIPVQPGIAKKTIIECFGTYWHKYPLSRPIDIKRCIELRNAGWRVLVFWENEIRLMELNDLINSLNN